MKTCMMCRKPEPAEKASGWWHGAYGDVVCGDCRTSPTAIKGQGDGLSLVEKAAASFDPHYTSREKAGEIAVDPRFAKLDFDPMYALKHAAFTDATALPAETSKAIAAEPFDPHRSLKRAY